jgi:hypothetical protein
MKNQTKNVTQKIANACLAQCQKLFTQVQQAKDNVVAEFRSTFGPQQKLLRLAVNEAEALAWQTDYPHLVFPSLALEKVNTAASWQQRQQLIRRPQFAYAFAA